MASSLRGSAVRALRSLAHSTQYTTRSSITSYRVSAQTAIRNGTLKHIRLSSTSTSELPLDGITVVALEQAIAAPFCTRQLAELGARVIKVERPGEGDFARAYDTRVGGQSSHFVWTNRSKESLALNVKDPKEFKVLKALLAKADVLVQNLAPGASERLGLGWDRLKEENDKIIVCDISGYGSYGPYTHKKAYDLLVQSEAGLLSITGTPTTPAKVGISVADIAAGTAAFQNILAALLKRGKTGKGSRIDISMLESMAEWMSFPMYYAYEGQEAPKRAGAEHATVYPYGPFGTGGGGSVMLGIQNEREWAKLCEIVLGDANLATDERFKNNSLRSQNRAELKAIIVERFSMMSAEEVLVKLDEATVANAKVNDMKGLWDHPQLKARGRWTEVDTPAGRVPALLPAGVAIAADARIGPVPKVGEHNAKILEELGM